MKTRKTLTYRLLLQEVIDQVKNRFKPKVTNIKVGSEKAQSASCSLSFPSAVFLVPSPLFPHPPSPAKH